MLNLRWEGNNLMEEKKTDPSHVTRLTRRVLKKLITFLRTQRRRVALRPLAKCSRQIIPSHRMNTSHHVADSAFCHVTRTGLSLIFIQIIIPRRSLLFCLKWIFHVHGSESPGNFTLTCSTSTGMIYVYIFYFCNPKCSLSNDSIVCLFRKFSVNVRDNTEQIK